MTIKRIAQLLLATITTALVGCGGGGGTPATTISGVAMKGPINGADVSVYAITNNNKGALLGSGKSNPDGSYSFALTSTPSGPVLVEVTANATSTFADEVSGVANVPFATTMRTMITSVTANTETKVAVTPLTEMAVKKAEGAVGKFTPANIDEANTLVGKLFGVTGITSTIPFDPSKAPPANATVLQKQYASTLGAFSQLVNTKKGTGTLSASLTATLAGLGNELQTTGGISGASVLDMNAAIDAFNANTTKNQTGTVLPTIKPTGAILKISAAGLLTNALISSADITVTLPAGVTIKTDTAGIPLQGTVVRSGVAATLPAGSTIDASVVNGNQLHFVLVTANATAGAFAGFSNGEFVTINCDVASTATFPLPDGFVISNSAFTDSAVAPLTPTLTKTVGAVMP